MFSSPLLATDPTRLPGWLRGWIGRRLSGPPRPVNRRTYRAVLFQLDRLGDFVLATSVIRLLLAHWGETECLLVLTTAAAPLAAREFPRTPQLVLPVNAPSLTRDLLPVWRRRRPEFARVHADHLVCLSHHRDLYKSVALSWISAGQRHQLDRQTYPATVPDGVAFELEADRRLAAAVLQRDVSLEEIEPRLTHRAAHDGPDLLVCPIASERVRQLPEDLLLAALALWRRRSAAPVTLGGPVEAAAALEGLAGRVAAAGLGPVGVAPTASFDDFLGRIAGAGAVLAVESAPSHLAVALDKRTCVVMGGGTFGLCAPWRRSARQQHVRHQVACYGCGWRCSQPEVRCLTGIAPADIAAALPAL